MCESLTLKQANALGNGFVRGPVVCFSQNTGIFRRPQPILAIMSAMRIQLPARWVPAVSTNAVALATPGAFARDDKIAPDLEQVTSDPWVSHLVNVSKGVYEKSVGRESPKELNKFLTRQGCTEIKWFDRWITQAVGYVKDGHRCVVFRGTQQKRDWMMDGLCFYYGSPPRHFGFHQAWVNVRADVVEWLQSTPSVFPGVFLSGHSLGAATAVVAALDLVSQKANNIEIQRVVLFGCPRVGPYEFWKRYKDAGLHQKTKRFEHEDDGICVIPPPLFFVHVGQAPALARVQPVVNPPVVSPLADVANKPATFQSKLAAAANLLHPDSPYRESLLHFVLLTFGMAAFLWLTLLPKFPDSLWLNPTKITLGRRSPVLACLLFALLFVAAHLLFGIVPYSSQFQAEIHESSRFSMILFWFTTVVEAIILQQATYFALFRIPTLPRLLLSLLAAGLTFRFFPVRQIEAVAVPFLALLVVLILAILYRAAGGSPAHSCELYVKAFSDPEWQKSNGPGSPPEVSPDLAKLFLMMERISHDPQGNAYFLEGLAKIRRKNP